MSKKSKIDEATERFLSKKIQLMTAGIMLLLAAGPIAAAYFYVPPAAADVLPMQAEVLLETTGETEAPSTAGETAVEEEIYTPTPGELNLAYFYPEGADTSKLTESFAGQAFKVLMTQDESWMGSIYDMADATPQQMASALGKSRSSVLGQYNYKDEQHDPKNPDSWTINSFKKVRLSFRNGDGQAVSAYSNVIDIMSMANLYTYFKGVEDYDLFLSYSQALWNKSHSYSVGISEIYYCDGCLDEDAEQREYEELEAEARAEEAAGYSLTSEYETAEPETVSDHTEHTAAETAAAVIVAGSTKRAEEETAAGSTETVPEADTETVPESTSAVIIAGQANTQTIQTAVSSADALADISLSEEPHKAEAEAESSTASAEELVESEAVDPGQLDSDEATPSNAGHTPSLSARSAIRCPGHVDLIVNAKVTGLKEENGLFKQDSIGNDSAGIEENGWPGWNNNTKASARLLSSQDWFEKYGLSLSVISMRNPLTDAEIESYMNQLPADLSRTRKDLIHFALSSVGKVPYYWGGKPSAPNYAGNSFGTLAAPDDKGRVLRGLDCSGWINWVYWSVTGERLPYESTSGLAISGSRTTRSELKPGDIIVRTGTDAHVIMFLGWTVDGKIRCIHESSAGVNNVTVAIRDANWPYYRKLVD